MKYADVWLQPKLGTDIALLNGLMNVIIREAWIDEDFIIRRVERGLDAFAGQLKVVVADYPPDIVEAITGVAQGKLLHGGPLFARGQTKR